MKKMVFAILATAFALAFQLTSSAQTVNEDSQLVYKMPKTGNYMRYKVENGDTVYVASIRPAVKYAKGKGTDWRKESRLLHNFGKTYPYALEARRVMDEVDNNIESNNLAKRKKEKYINALQKELLDKYEPVIRNMTVSQGKLLIKLIGRETGLTPYEIIHDYKNGMAAGTWQGIAKLFGGDLKKTYDPKGEDKAIEYLVQKWEIGDYPALYMSVFGRYPEIAVIPQDKPKKAEKAESKSKKSSRKKS